MNLVAASRLARELMDQHGLKAWTFEFDDAVRRAGMCSYGKRRISLSAPLTRIHDEREVRDTILHEVAHAIGAEGEARAGVARGGGADRVLGPAVRRPVRAVHRRAMGRGVPGRPPDDAVPPSAGHHVLPVVPSAVRPGQPGRVDVQGPQRGNG